MSSRVKCKINTDGSVCLLDILDSFNSSIKEEHAWALCYQCAKYYKECLLMNKSDIYIATDVQHVYLQTDGNVHENTIIITNKDQSRRVYRCEKDIVTGLGIVIYNALDKNNDNDVERVISHDLEQLISDMVTEESPTITTSESSTSSQQHHETDDEGIERDADENYDETINKSIKQQQLNLNDVIRRCELHLGTLTKQQSEAHYKAVVRALVAEALELSTFLERVAQGTVNLPTNSKQADLEQLKYSDWAKFWVQVMNELRMGVKLKKVHYSKAPIEYELTPYEILMKDIRSCRYNLRKIMVNGNVPSRITKDAHAIILEFIRSRPPLKKVTDRKLPPQKRTLTPREQLLNSIKKGRKLRPVSRASCLKNDSKQSVQEETTGQKSNRRLIKVDFSQFNDDFDDDDGGTTTTAAFDSPDSSSEPGLWGSEVLQICDNNILEPYDLATQDLNLRSSGRRHTLEVYNGGNNTTNIGCYSVPQSRPGSRQSCNSSEAESVHNLEPDIAKAIQDELISPRTWQDTISLDDRLSLTLSEIVHIRTVLTKAELEALPVEARVRHDVEARKVCFLCLKTRFGIFGPWGQRCTLCKRTVCSRCYSKMNIPMEHFSSVPVVLLSPSIMCSPDDEHSPSTSTFPKAFINNRMVEASSASTPSTSADHSPITSSPKPTPTPSSTSMTSSTISDPGSSSINRLRTRAAAVGRAARVVDKFKGSQMVVCHDCRMLVLQIIKSARANRSAIRNKTLQSLTLNLSPVF